MSLRDQLLQTMEHVRQRVSSCETGFTEFVATVDFPPLYRDLERAEPILASLGVYELLWAAAEQAEGLLRADRIGDAEDVLRRAAESLVNAGE